METKTPQKEQQRAQLRAAASELEHAAQWLRNGGPASYDIGEAVYHVQVAMRLIERARS